ncbi:MAG: hypothetical protein ACI82H_002211, partial [Alphaproteobacteria bacterium]
RNLAPTLPAMANLMPWSLPKVAALIVVMIITFLNWAVNSEHTESIRVIFPSNLWIWNQVVHLKL